MFTLAWWQLWRNLSRKALVFAGVLAGVLGVGITAGVVSGVAVGIGQATTSVVNGLVSGLLGLLTGGLEFGIVFGLPIGLLIAALVVLGRERVPARTVRVRVRRLVIGIVIGLYIGLSFSFGAWHRVGVAGVLAGVLFITLAGGLVIGLVGVPGDITGETSPDASLARDRQLALLLMLVVGPGFGLATGLMVGFSVTTAIGPGPGLSAGLTTGLAVAFVADGLSVRGTAWPSYMLTKGWLALRHRLPWSLKDFLADAHRRGVLRQAGAVYQFRHIELQHRLASRNTGERKTDLAAVPTAANRQPLA